VARFRLARPAQIDLANILATSVERWGMRLFLPTRCGRSRWNQKAHLRRSEPNSVQVSTASTSRHARRTSDTAKVRRPVHVLYYRVAPESVIEIVRVLHEKMDPSRHLDELSTENDI
jgi:toxin ParE1/3/4